MQNQMVLVINGQREWITCAVCPIPRLSHEGTLPNDETFDIYYGEATAKFHGWTKDGVDWICPKCAKEIGT